MQLYRFIEALRNDLTAIAGLGGEAAAEAARQISISLGNALGLRLFEALGEAVLELNAQLPSGRVEVRLVGQDPELVYVDESSEPAAVAGDDALTARITLRRPDGVKRNIEAAAAREGVSVNTWIVRALGRSLHGPAQRSGNRITGYARS